MRDLSYLPFTIDGHPILTDDEIEALRREKSKSNIIAQKGCQEKFLSSDADIVIIGGNRGGCLPVDTPVCTPFGWRKIGDLKRGDIITGLDGGMQKVVYNSHNGVKDLYRMTFVDGVSVLCSPDHLWNVKKTNYTHKKRHMYGLDRSADWRVMDTESIIEHLKKQKGKKYPMHLMTPLCEPVKFTQPMGRRYKPTTDPYLMGVILGDGCISNAVQEGTYTAIITAAEQELIDRVSSLVHIENTYKVKGKEVTELRLLDDALQKDLDALNLMGHTAIDKFIPYYYKYGTVEQRFSLIQGLMDTDGTIESRGHCSYSTISKQLAEDVAFVIRSLGGLATVRKNKAGYRKDGEYIECNDVYNVYIRIKESERIFGLERKKKLARPYNGGNSEYGRRIVSCELESRGEVCCIRVTNPDSLYITQDFIVTHNSKSFSLLLEGLKDVYNSNFNALLLRNERGDLDDLVLTAEREVYHEFGTYNRSQDLMSWQFKNGGKLRFSYYAGAFTDFETRFRGRQFAYVGIDEVTQIDYKKFKFLVTCNRNAYGIRNRFYGSCNPDPDSWVRKFIDWWIGEDGMPIEERDGVMRYCFMDGDTPDTIYWGNTPKEVYEQCKHIIDSLWKDEYETLGFDKVTMFVKSVTFIRGRLEENIALIASDPNYAANLAQQGEEARARDLDGNWNFKQAGGDRITMEDMEHFYGNSQCLDDHTLYVSADIAFEGGDFMVMWLWEGLHIKDVFVSQGSAVEQESVFKTKVMEWGVREENVVFDFWGVGQAIAGHMPRAVKFTGTKKPDPPFDKSYKNVKSQCAEILVHLMQDRMISIEPRLLERRFTGKGRKYTNARLYDILMKERKCVRHKETSSVGGFDLIDKVSMIKAVGYSPDFFESLIYRMWYEIHKQKQRRTKVLQYAQTSGVIKKTIMTGSIKGIRFS